MKWRKSQDILPQKFISIIDTASSLFRRGCLVC